MDSKQLFTQKSDHYALGRPTYATALIEYLFKEVGFNKNSVIADIGAGTGIFAKQLADFCDKVICVEPNEDMRRVAYDNLSTYSNLQLVNGDAENTTLESKSVDYITAAQSFHWFDIEKFKVECKRILKPNGKVILIWNMRDSDCDLYKENYKIFAKYCPQFKGFSSGMVKDDPRIIKFFSGRVETIQFNNPLIFDKEKFINRCLSSSYSLNNGDDGYDEYIKELTDLFNRFSYHGILTMPNKTIAYIGKVE